MGKNYWKGVGWKLDFWIFGFLDSWIVGLLDFWMLGGFEAGSWIFWIFGCLDSWIFGGWMLKAGRVYTYSYFEL